jgi:endonuclease/exonuclease/phosphatase family metal-dependent hydrolase
VRNSDSTSANRRNIEATTIRSDVATHLPPNPNAIYLGDFNTYNGNAAMLQTLTGLGSDQGFDPINKMNWTATSSTNRPRRRVVT